jgi:hypothetical protein
MDLDATRGERQRDPARANRKLEGRPAARKLGQPLDNRLD